MNDKDAIAHVIGRLSKELSPSLFYHCLEHTQDVLQTVEQIALAESISDDDMRLLRTAAAYHDCGFLWSYNNHEEKGCEYAREVLPGYGYSPEQLKTITELIMSTKIPQRAETVLGKILCDADLDYLGRGDENYDRISEDLRKELIENGIDLDKKKWLDIQITFLEDQHYFTSFAKSQREEKKKEVLSRLKDLRTKLFDDSISS